MNILDEKAPLDQCALSPFLIELVRNALDTIADELALIIMRTAYSSIVRDAMDYSTAVCDAAGATLAQGLTTPLHLGTFYDAMTNLIASYAGRIYEGVPDRLRIGVGRDLDVRVHSRPRAVWRRDRNVHEATH